MRFCRLCDVYGITRRSFSPAGRVTVAAKNAMVVRARSTKQEESQDVSNYYPMTHFVFGANTDIGKTVLTAALIRAASVDRDSKRQDTTHYIKPLQCGGSDESFIRKHASDHLSSAATLFKWNTFSSPHLASRLEDKPVSDKEVLKALSVTLDDLGASARQNLSVAGNRSTNNATRDSIWIETAGGVMSPSSSSPDNQNIYHAKNGTGGWGWMTQVDLYKGFRDRASVVLVGDGRLGGISSTLTALETLLHRTYSVMGILLLDQDTGGDKESDRILCNSNLEALREYASTISASNSDNQSLHRTTTAGMFADLEKSIISLPALPPEPEPLNEWFDSSDVQDKMARFVHEHLFESYAIDHARS